MKKIGIFIFVLVLAGAGFFYWQNSQKDVQALNKNLPAGVKAVKSIFGFGDKYKVVNKIDGYEFKVPSAWKGVDKVIYTPERTEEGYTGSSIEVVGREGGGRSVGVDRFKAENSSDLETWANNFFEKLKLVGEFVQDKIEEIEIIKTQENIHLGGDYVYFFKKDATIYTITGGSEEFIREIISNGKW